METKICSLAGEAVPSLVANCNLAKLSFASRMHEDFLQLGEVKQRT
jgi:hypothetical protein